MLSPKTENVKKRHLSHPMIQLLQNIDGENLHSKKQFDILLTLLQFVPASITLVYNFFDKREDAIKAIIGTKEAIKKKVPVLPNSIND